MYIRFVKKLSFATPACTLITNEQHVGQRLMDLGVFAEIHGTENFVVSGAVYYQFCPLNTTTLDRTGARR